MLDTRYSGSSRRSPQGEAGFAQLPLISRIAIYDFVTSSIQHIDTKWRVWYKYNPFDWGEVSNERLCSS